MLYFDIDGVVRDLFPLVWGHVPHTWGEETPDGKNIFDKIDADLAILSKSKPTVYYSAIKNYAEHLKVSGEVIKFISSQPKKWQKYTDEWLLKYFGEYDVMYTASSNEKLKLLKNKSDLLIDDSSNFNDYSKIVLVRYPYNDAVLTQYKPYATINTQKELGTFLNKFLK